MANRLLQKAVVLGLTVLLHACGGGGSGGDGTTTTLPPVDPPIVSPAPTSAEINSASRLAARATFGLPFVEIEQVAEQGPAAWLEAQFLLPVGSHQAIVTELLARNEAGEFISIEEEFEAFEFIARRLAWWQQTINGADPLRQRVAYSLSQIFVVSDTVDQLIINPYASSNYYDTLLAHAFGNYRDLLRAVALHPAMGIYLSHVREFAKIFTGLSFAGPRAFFGNPVATFRLPMRMFDAEHEPGEKYLLNGLIVPADQTGMMDIESAIDNLFNHPNVGPFIGKQLIQRLVASNPSSDYVERVARAFNGSDSGVRGDMKAVLRAILLDPEAIAPVSDSGTFGKLREPLLRYTALLRQFNVTSPDGFFANYGYLVQTMLRQHPLSAPSVFNFFLPTHTPPGELAEAGLAAPEFQITTSGTIAAVSNLADIVVLAEQANDFAQPPFTRAQLQLDDYRALAANVDDLLDRLDTLMTYGTLAEENRGVIRDVLLLTDDTGLRVKLAIYLIFISPDYAVQL